MTAKETAGKAVPNQRVLLYTSAVVNGTVDDWFWEDNSPYLTVVSAPAADLLIRPDTCDEKGVCSAKDFTELTGYLDILARPLKYRGYDSDKGSSSLVEWQAQLDVSDFPEGTLWYADAGRTVLLEVNDGLIDLGKHVGDYRVYYKAPEKWNFDAGWLAETFDVHLIVPKDAFSTGDFLNNGDGWEPGQAEDKYYQTDDDRGTGARPGYFYPNNDWTAVRVTRPDDHPGIVIFSKGLFRPWDTKQTLWEPGNVLSQATDPVEGGLWTQTPKNTYYAGKTSQVTPGTELLAHLSFRPKGLAATCEEQLEAGEVEDPEDCWQFPEDKTRAALIDIWQPEEQSPDFTNGREIVMVDGAGEPVPHDWWTVQWSTTITAATIDSAFKLDDDSEWVTSDVAPEGARALRIVLDPVDLTEENSILWEARVPFIVADPFPEPLEEHPVFDDRMFGVVEKEGGHYATAGTETETRGRVVPITDPQLEAGLTVTSSPKDFLPASANSVDYVFTPTVKDFVSSKQGVGGSMVIEFDPCTAGFELQGDFWQIESIDPDLSEWGTTCGDPDARRPKLTLKPDPDWTLSQGMLDDGRTAQLPPVIVKAEVSKRPSDQTNEAGDHTFTAVGTWSPEIICGKETGCPSAEAQATSTLTRDHKYLVENELYTTTPKVEVEDELHFQAVAVNFLRGRSTDGAKTIVALPGSGAGKNDPGRDEDPYRAAMFPGVEPQDFPDGIVASDFAGQYTVKSIKVDPRHSVDGTTFECTTGSLPANLDPVDNNLTWYKAADCEKYFSGLTAIRVLQPGAGTEESSKVDIVLQPTKNTVDDEYLMWIGPTRGGGIDAEDAVQGFPRYDKVVSSHIAGRVYLDQTGLGLDWREGWPEFPPKAMGAVTVGLYRSKDDKTPIATVETDEKGQYNFDANDDSKDLRHGSYWVKIVDGPGCNRNPESVQPDDDGNHCVFDQIPSASSPSNLREVHHTFAYQGQRYLPKDGDGNDVERPIKPWSSEIKLGLDSRISNVNFGFFYEDPYADLMKHASQATCDDSDSTKPCDLAWDIDINTGSPDSTRLRVAEVATGVITNDQTIYFGGHTLVRTEDGRVFGWGKNWKGMFDSEIDSDFYIESPQRIGFPDDADIKKVAVGSFVLAAIDVNGRLFIWGSNYRGQVTGESADSLDPDAGAYLEPRLFTKLGEAACFSDIAFTPSAAFALTCEGDLYTWGFTHGANGTGLEYSVYSSMFYPPAKVAIGAPVANFAVSEGGFDPGGIAVDVDGKLYQWGATGRELDGRPEAIVYPQKIDLPQGVKAESVARSTVEPVHYMVDTKGNAYSWGLATNSANDKLLGQGDGVTAVDAPELLTKLQNQRVTSISSEYRATSAVTDEGSVWTWGNEWYTSVSDKGDSALPVEDLRFPKESKVLSMSAGAALGLGYWIVLGADYEVYGVGRMNEWESGILPGHDGRYLEFTRLDYDWGTATQYSEFSSNLPLTYSTLNDLTSADVYGVGVTAEVKRNKTDENGNPVQDGEGKPVVETVRTYEPLLLKGEEAQVGAGSSPVMQLVAREYDLGTLHPGDWVEAHFSGKVDRPGLGADPAGLVVGNQAWFTSKETPRQQPTLSETPALPTFDNQNPFAYGKWGKDNPQGDPDGSLWDKCSATKDWELPGDQCDMVFASIPGHDQPVGHLSGNVWKADADRPDYQAQNDELLSDVRVELHRGDPGAEVDAPRTTFTDENGHYEFKNLPVGDDYRVFVDRVSIPTQAGNSLRFVEPHWGQNPQGSAPKSDNSFAYDSYVTTWIPGDTPMVSVEANKWRDHVNAGLFETKAAISVVKMGQDLDEQWKNHIGAGYDTAYPIRATITNTGEEPIDHLVFTDETRPVSKGQVDVKWEKCVFPDYNGASQEEYSFKDPNSLPVAFAPGITLDVGASFHCFGEMPGMPVDAEDHLDTVTVTGVSTKSGTDVRDDDDFTASLDPDSIPEPKIHLEKGILVDALTGEDGKPVCPNGSVRHRYDDSCWIKETALVPGGSVELTFRVTNVGDEDLLDLEVVDEVLEGDATLAKITCEWPTKETANGVRRWLPSRDTMTTETPNWVDCQAKLTFADGSLAEHLNQAWASGVGAISGKHTNDDSDFKAVAVLSTPFLLEKLGDGGATDRLVGSQWGLFDLEGVPVEDVEPLLCAADEADASDAVGDPAQDACQKAIVAEKAERGEWKPDLFVIAGLPAGKYLLGEVKAPEGYNLLAEAIEIVVSPDGTVALGEGSQSSATVGAHESEMQIVSVSDSLSIGGLPLTGQSGPWMWLVVGTLIVSVSWFYMNRGARAFRRAR